MKRRYVPVYQKKLQQHQLKASDIVFENIIQHIRLLVFRITQNNTLTNDERTVRTATDKYDLLTEDLVSPFGNGLSHYFFYYGKNYLHEQLRGKIFGP